MDNGPLQNQAKQCNSCAERTLFTDKCTAFPEGIPQAILQGDFDHRKPYPGDNGVRWKPLVAKSAKGE